jgi:hypothetical protein
VSVRELRSQEAQHDSGAVVRNAGREAVQVEHLGHTWTLDVDRGLGAILFYLPASPAWDDGTPIPAEVVAQIKDILAEVEDFWGSAAEFRQLEAGT